MCGMFVMYVSKVLSSVLANGERSEIGKCVYLCQIDKPKRSWVFQVSDVDLIRPCLVVDFIVCDGPLELVMC